MQNKLPTNITLGQKLPHRYRRWLIAFIPLGVGLAFLAWWLLIAQPKIRPSLNQVRSLTTPSTIRFFTSGLNNEQRTQLQQIIEASVPNNPLQSTETLSESDISFTLSDTQDPDSYPLSIQTSTQPITTTSIVQSKKSYLRLKTNDRITANQLDSLKSQLTKTFSTPPTWTYLAIGDIIPARDVYTASKRLGYTYPYLKIAERTKQADLAVTNLETTIADGQANGEGAGMMVFTAPAKAMDGLTYAGIDGVSLANNHAMNGGPAKVLEMMANLTNRNIGHFGVQAKALATNSWQTTVKGVRITHLSFNSVPGSIEPTANGPGLQRIPVKPWGNLTESDIKRVQLEITNAKQTADVVIPWFQWGTEYTHSANPDQRRLAQAAIDAGADIVIATHPHWTQGLEWYKDHLIAYSLGNFVFDQNWSEETKRSIALELTFSGKRLIAAKIHPARIENGVQPRWLEPNEPTYSQIINDLAQFSWWP